LTKITKLLHHLKSIKFNPMKNILTFFYLFITVAIFAQAPQKFNYQAVARNAQGAVLANQSIKIRASILDASANGISQYSETHSITSNSLGLFTLAIGGGNAVSGKFTDITWSSGDKYLKIEMDATGGNNFTLMGTSQLLSVPYALSAGNGSQWKNTTNGIYYESNWVGINSREPQTTLQVNGQLQVGGNNSVGGGFDALPFTKGENNAALWIGTHDNNGQSDFGVIYGESDTTQNEAYQLNIIVGDNGENEPSNINGYADKIFLGNVDLTTPGQKYGITIAKASIGVNNFDPKSRVHVTNGDVFIDTSDKGVIMKSPSGQCWRMTVSDVGQPVFSSITCP
jgi:hypothetical protein